MASEETIAAHLAHLRAQIEGGDYNVEYKGGAGRADPEQRGQVYEYRTLTFGIDTPVTRGLRPGALGAIRAAGGELWSMFACGAGIGMFSTQLIVMTAWESERALEDAGGVVLSQFDGVVESSVERLIATIRPVGPQLQPLHLNHGTGQPCVCESVTVCRHAAACLTQTVAANRCAPLVQHRAEGLARGA